VGNVRAALSALLGLLAIATMPVAVLATRYFEQYDLVHAAVAIPLALLLAFVALGFARSAGTYDAVRLGRAGGGGAARAGRLFAWGAIWLSGSCAVAVAIWGILEYQASR